MIICNICNRQINDTARFCEHCGNRIENSEVKHLPSTNVAVVEIQFAESRSPNFRLALEACQRTGSYKESINGGRLFYSVTLKALEIELICRVWKLVGSWKSSSFFINDSTGTLQELLKGGCTCYRKHLKARNVVDHCFGTLLTDKNIWGCKALDMPESGIYGRWYRHGEFGADGLWHFNKLTIKDLLERGMHKNRHCPVLDRKRILEAFKKTPDTADPDSEMCLWWETDRDVTEKGLVERKVGVAPNYKNYDL